MNRKGSAVLVVILIIIIALAIAGVAWYYVAQWNGSAPPPPVTTSSNQTSSTISDQYGLFTQSFLESIADGADPTLQYIDGGTITTGTYSGYHRVIAATVGYWQPQYFTAFATKDYKTFIAAGDNLVGTSSFDLARVIGFGNVPLTNTPDNIPIGNFTLVWKNIYSGDPPASSASLQSLVPGLSFYGDRTGPTSTVSNSSYSTYGDDILVKDASGPLSIYHLIPQETWPSSSIGFGYLLNGSTIKSDAPLYTTYGGLGRGGCDDTQISSVIDGISQADLVSIGTSSHGIPLDGLRNSDDSLNKLEYQAEQSNTVNTSFPSYAQYIKKNPVLLFQDPWSRWIAVGEFDYNTGACAW